MLLDTEIWKASVMLNEKLPSKAEGGAKGNWKDLGFDWNKGNSQFAVDVGINSESAGDVVGNSEFAIDVVV